MVKAFPIFLQGLGLTLSLILGIGPQNVFIIRQGARRNHVLAVVLTTMATEIMLVSLGVAGLGSLMKTNRILQIIIGLAGMIFLVWFGFKSLCSALRTSHALQADGASEELTLKQALYGTLAVSILNPWAVLDTVVIIGGAAAQYNIIDKIIFACGSLSISTTWFCMIGFGASKISHVLKNPLIWRWIDGFVAILMWLIAGSIGWKIWTG
jgi:L-lysine exporter family protein LysE/ArgO